MSTPIPTPIATLLPGASHTPSPRPSASHVIIDHLVGVPTWLQVALALLGFATSVTLVIVTWKYVLHTKDMATQMKADALARDRQFEREAEVRAKEIERQAQERRQEISRDAAGSLSSAFWDAVQTADNGRWAYQDLARPLQRQVSEHRARLVSHQMQERVAIATDMLGHAYPDPNHPDAPPVDARDKVIPALKHLGDALTAYQLGEPLPDSVLPLKERAREWVRDSPKAAPVADYQLPKEPPHDQPEKTID